MSAETTPATARVSTPIGRAIGVAVGGAVVAAVVVMAFVWPTRTLDPRHILLSITGPSQAVSALETKLADQRPGVFDFVPATSRDEAVTQIKDRTSYGAIVLGAQGTAPEVLTAPPASPQIAQQLGALAGALQGELAKQFAAAGLPARAAEVKVTPVVTLSASDQTGAGISSVAFPLVFAGTLGGVIATFVLRGRRSRLTFLAIFALAAATAITAVLQGWFGFLQGNAWLNIAALALGVGATSSFIAGLAHLFGRIGMFAAIAFGFLIANPISSAATPWQFIAEPWGAIGQYLIPGATNHALRSLSYFPDADTSAQFVTLLVWLGVSLLAFLVPKRG